MNRCEAFLNRRALAGHAYQPDLQRARRCSQNADVRQVRARKLTMLAKSIEYGFTHVQAVDKVTDIASWQAVVPQGWPIYSVICEHERCRFSPRTPHLYPSELVLCAHKTRRA